MERDIFAIDARVGKRGKRDTMRFSGSMAAEEIDEYKTEMQMTKADMEASKESASASASAAAASAEEAAASDKSAKTSADSAKESLNSAMQSATSAEGSATAAAGSATAAGKSASDANLSALQSSASADNASASAESAATIASNASQSANAASASAASASTSADSAKTSASSANESATSAASSATTAETNANKTTADMNTAKGYMESALASKNAAADSASAAADSATKAELSESWAVGGTGKRDGEDTNNSKYWAEQAAESASKAAGLVVGVNAFNGRSGDVKPQAGDYSFSLLSGAVDLTQLPDVTTKVSEATTSASGLMTANEKTKVAKSLYRLDTKTLTAGETSLTWTDSNISSDAAVDVYASIYGVAPTAMAFSGTTITVTFKAQTADMDVCLMIATAD